jgi:hypothetical protein
VSVTSVLADTIAQLITAMPVDYLDPAGQAQTDYCKAYRWAPRDLDALPAGVVELPSIDRGDAADEESEIGSRTFRIEYPVTFYVALDEAALAQTIADAIALAFIDAIDQQFPYATHPNVDDVRVNVDRPEVIEDARPLITVPARVQLLALIP